MQGEPLSLPVLLRELRAGLEGVYQSRLRALFLFGSYARGEADAESDVDVLIVLDVVAQYGAEIDRTSQLISSLSLAYGVSISRCFVSEDTWRLDDTPFLANVRDEAIAA
jgi:predicted nucleotidyltransferase